MRESTGPVGIGQEIRQPISGIGFENDQPVGPPRVASDLIQRCGPYCHGFQAQQHVQKVSSRLHVLNLVETNDARALDEDAGIDVVRRCICRRGNSRESAQTGRTLRALPLRAMRAARGTRTLLPAEIAASSVGSRSASAVNPLSSHHIVRVNSLTPRNRSQFAERRRATSPICLPESRSHRSRTPRPAGFRGLGKISEPVHRQRSMPK